MGCQSPLCRAPRKAVRPPKQRQAGLPPDPGVRPAPGPGLSTHREDAPQTFLGKPAVRRGRISTSRPNSTRPRPGTQGTSARGPEGAQTGTGAAASCVAATATSRGSYWDRDPAREGTEQREYMKQEGGLDTCPASARGPRGRSSDAGQWQVVREAREQGLAGQTFLGHLQNFPFSLRWAQ